MHEVDLHRRVGCAQYWTCLDRAVRRSWISFTCVRCFAFRPLHEDRAETDWARALAIVARGLGNRLFPSIEMYLRCRRVPGRD
jgi:hypothetical protein